MVLPALLYVIAAFVIFGLAVMFVRTILPAWREQSRRNQSREWPSVRARLDHACVTEYRPSDTRVTFRLDAWFSYSVEGEKFEGSYSNGDLPLEYAKQLLAQLNREPVMVAYNPKKPAEYFYEPARKGTTEGPAKLSSRSS